MGTGKIIRELTAQAEKEAELGPGGPKERAGDAAAKSVAGAIAKHVAAEEALAAGSASSSSDDDDE